MVNTLGGEDIFSAASEWAFRLSQPRTLLVYWIYIVFETSWKDYHQEVN